MIVHLAKTVLRMLSISLAYLLMLVAMNYYYGHIIAIIVGFGVGHYFFDTSTINISNVIKSQNLLRKPIETINVIGNINNNNNAISSNINSFNNNNNRNIQLINSATISINYDEI